MDAISTVLRLAQLFGVKEERNLLLDNAIFKMHYKATVAVLMASAMILSGNNWMGKAISCLTTEDVSKDVTEGFCYSTGGYTIHPLGDDWNWSIQPEELYPGVGPIANYPAEHRVVYHYIYKWIPFFCIILAGLNYLPHLLWKTSERHDLHVIVQYMDSRNLHSSEDDRREENKAAKWFHIRRGTNTYCVVGFIACELMNVFNCALQMFLINWMFDYHMWSHQADILRDVMTTENQLLILHRVFPKVVKCDLSSYGVSGSKVVTDAVCYLHQNYFLQSVCAFLWLWFFFTGILTLTYILIFRSRLLFKKERVRYLLRLCPIADIKDIHIIVNNLCYSDVFILLRLCQLIQPFHREAMFKELARYIKTSPSLTQKYYTRGTEVLGHI